MRRAIDTASTIAILDMFVTRGAMCFFLRGWGRIRLLGTRGIDTCHCTALKAVADGVDIQCCSSKIGWKCQWQ